MSAKPVVKTAGWSSEELADGRSERVFGATRAET